MNTKGKYLFLFFVLASILTACGAPALTPTSDPVSTPVLAPASTSADPAAIAQGFWDAITAKNIDAAMAFIADDVKALGGPVYFTTKAGFSTFMASESKRGIIFEISDVKGVSEDTATYTMKVYDNGIFQASESELKLQVKDGKIVLVEFSS